METFCDISCLFSDSESSYALTLSPYGVFWYYFFAVLTVASSSSTATFVDVSFLMSVAFILISLCWKCPREPVGVRNTYFLFFHKLRPSRVHTAATRGCMEYMCIGVGCKHIFKTTCSNFKPIALAAWKN